MLLGRKLLVGLFLWVAAGGLTACDGLLEVAPDDRFVDADKNPPLLREVLAGTQVDLNHTYDIWMYQSGMFGGQMVSLSFLRWAISQRLPIESMGLSGGLTGGFRNARGPDEAWYSYLQRALAGTAEAKRRILAGEFPIEDPPNSPELAEVVVRRGFELIWLADVWCDFVLDGQPVIYESMDGWRMAAENFEEALRATGARQQDRQAALSGLARVRRLLFEDQLAIQNAQQVTPSFQYQARYATTIFENTNRIWFRGWGFGEHSIHRQWRGLTLDATGIPDPRTALTRDPVPPRGVLDELWAPNKVPSGASPLNVTSGVEAQFIVAELVLNSDPQRTVDILNSIRSQRGVNVVWQPATLDPAVILDKLIDERRRTLFLEGVIVQDNRYWMKRYGKDLWHKVIPQGVPVGNTTCHPLQQREIDNIRGLPTYTYDGDPYLK